MTSRSTRISVILGVLVAANGIAACSTIHNGVSERVMIIASPPDAEISIDGEQTGASVLQMKLKRGVPHVIEVTKAGYRSVRVRTGNNIAPDYWGNFILVGAIGMSVDLLSGAAVGIEPNPIQIALVPGFGGPDERIDHSNGYASAGIVCAVLTIVEVAGVIALSHALH